MIQFISTMIVVYLCDTFVVSTSFFACKKRFNWHLSAKATFLALLILFGVLENILVPAVISLDLTFTIRNNEIASFFDVYPGYPAMELFSVGIFEIVTWSIQAYIGCRIGNWVVPSEHAQGT